MGLTRDIGRFLGDMRYEQVPPTGHPDRLQRLHRFRRRAARGLGRAGDGDRRALVRHSARRCRHRATLPAAAAPAPDLALLYGTAAHALDYDDTALIGHPSAVLVPAILAEAQEVGADGRR